MDWENYRFFVATANAGSVRGASEVLGVNPSTVTRRLDSLEESLGVMLFTRSASGLTLTQEAADVVAEFDAIASQIQALESNLKGRDQRVGGKIRVALPDVLAVKFLVAELAPFMAQYPDIDLDLIPGYQNLDVSKGAVDVAIRATENPPQEMVGRMLNRIALAAYARKDVAQELESLPAGKQIQWIDWAGDGEVMRLYRELRDQYFPDAHVHLRCDHVFMQHACVQAGMGLTILPCYLGDADEALLRLPHMPVQSGPAVWLITHPDLRNSRRIKLFMEFVREIFRKHAHEMTQGITTSSQAGTLPPPRSASTSTIGDAS